MIGIVAGENWTVFEFEPIFARKTIFDFKFHLPNFTQDNLFKEYGFAFSRGNIWIMRGNETKCIENKLISFFK